MRILCKNKTENTKINRGYETREEMKIEEKGEEEEEERIRKSAIDGSF